jgi:ArsR family transcriptional regulator
MEKYKNQIRLYKALMHPVRLAILDILREGEECVCHMEATLGYRQAYISQHLMVLREANLVEDRRDGWNIFYRVIQPEVYTVLDAVRQMLGVPDSATLPRPASPCPCPHCNKESNAVRFTEQIAVNK